MVGPHAIYSTTPEDLKVVKEFSEKYDSLVHIHVSETKKEVEDPVRKKGPRPIQYLEKLGLVNDKLIAAHCVWLDEDEAKIMAKNNAGIIHCPTSNSKLSAGAFNYKMLKETGIKKIGIGTDGSCSINSLDMFSELKTAALVANLASMVPTTFNDNELWDCVNNNQAEIYRFNCGEIKVGNLADVILADLENVLMQPQHNILSNLIYAANGSVVDTTICNGKVLMKNKIIEGEEQIIQEFKKHVKELFSRI
jgi:5-methylthioadenosine/S-adenosylhomocysteine deaminase